MPSEELPAGHARSRDLAPLLHALEQHGGTLTISSWASVPGSTTVQLHLPEDEYREKKCREVVAEWLDTR